jgi:hypothetical protein
MEFTLSIINRSNDRKEKVLFIIYKQRNRRQAIYVNNKVSSRTIAPVEKHYSEWLSVALDIQHGKHMRPYYSHLWPV